ncbi:MAG: DNA endonuclease SmrA [Pseudomonadales bacterium]|nr:DNA endonuclease SmrA [Pseudomonadales bacterium]
MSEDDKLFQQAMEGVVPQSSKAREKQPEKRKQVDLDFARKNAEHHPVKKKNLLTLEEVPQLAPRDILSWKQNGIQNAVFDKLKRGAYPVEGMLDLHGYTVKEASESLDKFIILASRKNQRLVLIAHGRGEKSKTPARLKSFLAQWLIQLPQVLAYHSAQPRDGGTGAVYAMLKKSAKSKQDNREVFGG